MNKHATAKRNRTRSSTAGAARAAKAAAQVAQGELLGFPARLLTGLPLGVKFGVQVHGLTCEIDLITTGAISPASTRGAVAFEAEEVTALAVAAQAERMRPSDFKGYCLRKLHDSSFRINEALALGGARADDGPAWSLARVFAWLEIELVSIELLERDRDREIAEPRDAVAA